MPSQKNPGGTDLALVAAAGAALYYFWPQISGVFGSSASVQAGEVIPTRQPTTASRVLPRVNSGFASTPTIDPLTETGTGSPLTMRGIRMRSLSGVRRLGSAALVAQAAMAQLRSDAGPQVTNNSPIGPWTPGAEQLPGGCWKYGNTPVLVNCPPGAAPPLPRPPARGRCAPGYTMDSAGICARTDDQVILAQLNSTPATGSAASRAYTETALPHLDPTILGVYASTIGIKPGSMLASIVGLPANPTTGVMEQGNDGFNYLPIQGTYVRQGTATQLTRPTGPIGPRIRLHGLAAIAGALPITNAALIAASNDPEIAAMIGNDPRAMLTIAQWNVFYTQATGVAQGAPRYPQVDPHELISATEYQQWRRDAGLEAAPKGMGMIRNSRPGAFPLGGISDGPNRQPFIQPGNANVYRIPGSTGVRLGSIRTGGGNHRWARSPFPRAAGWREAE